MDVLSDVLRCVRLSGAVLFRGEFSAPWSLTSPPGSELARMLLPAARHMVLLHIVASGQCWVRVDAGEPALVSTGDMIMLPRADLHTMGSDPQLPGHSVTDLLAPETMEALPTIEYGGGGPPTRIVCAFLHCDDSPFNPIAVTLPTLIHVAADNGQTPWLRAATEQLIHEAAAAAPGSGCLLARLTELLFVETLRRYIATLPADQTGWLAALNDPVVGRALSHLHAEPRRAWTVEDLARAAHSSRSVVSGRFRAVLGLSPMSYLARWRIQRAAELLRNRPDITLAAVAAEAGYGSEAAFSRAFKRIAGATPTDWRAASGQS